MKEYISVLGRTEIEWEHFDLGPYTLGKLSRVINIEADGFTTIKVGVTECVYWRYVACQGHRGMQSYFTMGYTYFFVLALDYGHIIGCLERDLIEYCKTHFKHKTANIKDGYDGPVGPTTPMYLYCAGRR